MITIDFSTAVAGFIFDLALVIALWAIYNCRGKKEADVQNSNYFRQCPYCCLVFFDYEKAVCAHALSAKVSLKTVPLPGVFDVAQEKER